MKTLTIIDENKIMMDNKLFIHLEDEEPTFSVGQWVICDKDNEIYRIEHFDGKWYCGNFGGGSPNGYKGKYIRPATPAEIESHLRKICDEKGFKEGVKFKDMDYGHIRTIGNKSDWFYSELSDCFHISTPSYEWNSYEGKPSNPVIYQRGKWVEIIPDKKKLPKTREEIKDLLIQMADECEYGIFN